MKHSLTKELLQGLYHDQQLNPYQIAERLGCDHKTIRSYLNKFEITLRTAQEYNHLPKRVHTSPSDLELFSKDSIIGHTVYLCEGWHTAKTSYLNFVNQDVSLVKIFMKCLKDTYKYTSTIRVEFVFNFTDESSIEKVDQYKILFSGCKMFSVNDPTRKNPIIRVRAGGVNLSREFIANAYKIIS